MEGASAKKSKRQTLVIRDIPNISDLKETLCDIIKIGKYYEYDVSSCMKTLIVSSDKHVVLLTIQALAELVKCDENRPIYGDEAIIKPLLNILQQDITTYTIDFLKASCRVIGNLCCDYDTSRQIILESGGVPVLINLLAKSVEMKSEVLKLMLCKCLINYAISPKFTESIVQGKIIDLLQRILSIELAKADFDDDTVSSTLTLLNLVFESQQEFLFGEEMNKLVLNVLQETASVEISELCLELLHAQAEHDSVKTLIAREGGIAFVCMRLEQLVDRRNDGEMTATDAEVEALMKQAGDLIIIVLTGDEAMHIIYNNGASEVYQTIVRWLDSSNYHLLTTSVLAIGNFARKDSYCTQMMRDLIFDKLLDIFDTYARFDMVMQRAGSSGSGLPIVPDVVNRVMHASVSALRNMLVARDNKEAAASAGRAAPALLRALPRAQDHHVAYKVLAALRMLVDGQVPAAKLVASNPLALASIARWAHAVEHPGAGGEAPRLLAWTIRQLRHHDLWRNFVQVEGCISSLVNMLVASHSVMQNEAILALTLLARESFKRRPPEEGTDFDYEQSFTEQLIKSEIGNHVTILVDTNCAKMPVEVAENLIAFLVVTSKSDRVALDYKEAKVPESLQKFSDTRNSLRNDLKSCISGIITAISDNGMAE